MYRIQKFIPIASWLPGYQQNQLSGDIFAGLTVGVMLIPQGMAYALIAGLPPVYGLYASIVPQLAYAIFGTSRQLSVAPVAMDSLMVATGVSVLATEGSDTYIAYTILVAFFMGLFQLLLGIARMGFITNLLSKPVISGFTSAAAFIIGLNQLKYLLGVDIEKSSKIHEILQNALQRLDETHLITLGIGVGGILLIKGLKARYKSIPGALVAVILGTLVVYSLNLQQEGVSIVETIPGGLPQFQIPSFNLGQLGKLIPLALTISVVAFMEAFSVAKAIEAQRNDHKVSANQELIALGTANLLGSLFQSYPVTGGFSRTAVNNQAGANTPLASIISAVTIAFTLMFLTPLFYFLPEAILASVIMVAVSSLVDFGYARNLWRENKLEFGLLAITFVVTLNYSMVPGIITGVIISVLILLYHAANPHIARLGRLKGHSEFRNVLRFKELELWDNLLILRIDAPFTFINIQSIKEFIESHTQSRIGIDTVILSAGPVSYIDATGVEGLRDLLRQLNQQKIRLLLTDVIGPVRDILHKTGLLEEIGTDNIYLTLGDAVDQLTDGSSYHHRDKALQKGLL